MLHLPNSGKHRKINWCYDIFSSYLKSLSQVAQWQNRICRILHCNHFAMWTKTKGWFWFELIMTQYNGYRIRSLAVTMQFCLPPDMNCHRKIKFQCTGQRKQPKQKEDIVLVFPGSGDASQWKNFSSRRSSSLNKLYPATERAQFWEEAEKMKRAR